MFSEFKEESAEDINFVCKKLINHNSTKNRIKLLGEMEKLHIQKNYTGYPN